MDQVTVEAAKICPALNVTRLITSFYNQCDFLIKENQLASFVCEYANIEKKMSSMNFWNGAVFIFGFAFGVPSAVLALLTFYRKEFDTVSFFYHRVINIFELVYMLFVFECALEWMTNDLKYESWIWTRFLTCFHYKLDLALPFAIRLITVWIAIERVAVCFTNYWFQILNRRRVAVGVVAAALLVSLAMYAPLAFTSKFQFDNSTGAYVRVRTAFAKTRGYDAYIRFSAFMAFVQFAMMISATAATILGLVRVSKRKRRLATDSRSKLSNRELIRQINVNKQLCLLQLCEAVPILLNCLLLVWLQSLSYVIDPYQLISMKYEEAVFNLRMFEFYLYLGISQTITELVEHSTHFYRYYVFSKKVRVVFKNAFKKNAVSQMTTIIK